MTKLTGRDRPGLVPLRSQIGLIGAYRQQAIHDPRETTAKARAAFLARFEREVDPDGLLPPEERARRVKAARKAHMALLAYRSSVARRRLAQQDRRTK